MSTYAKVGGGGGEGGRRGEGGEVGKEGGSGEARKGWEAESTTGKPRQKLKTLRQSFVVYLLFIIQPKTCTQQSFITFI